MGAATRKPSSARGTKTSGITRSSSSRRALASSPPQVGPPLRIRGVVPDEDEILQLLARGTDRGDDVDLRKGGAHRPPHGIDRRPGLGREAPVEIGDQHAVLLEPAPRQSEELE